MNIIRPAVAECPECSAETVIIREWREKAVMLGDLDDNGHWHPKTDGITGEPLLCERERTEVLRYSQCTDPVCDWNNKPTN